MSNKEFSQEFLQTIIFSKRKELGYSQQELSDLTGINRAMISKLEQGEYLPSIPQLLALSNVLEFEINSLFVSDFPKSIGTLPAKKIAVAGTGYVGLSIAVLLAQHHQVTAVDIIQEKVDLINAKKSPIQDDYIEKYLAEKDLNLVATLDAEKAYKEAEIVVIAAPTNYDSAKNYFDTSHVESVIQTVLSINPQALMVIKSTIPVGFTQSMREKFGTENIIFSPEFLRESKALYDNLYPSRIIVSCEDGAPDSVVEGSKLFA
ncbi:TPA: helix-turn-helix domain-containing protein, partial [Streptococcus suis]